MSRERWLLRAWAGLVLVLAARLLWDALDRGADTALAFASLRLDPNVASVEELQLLPGIGRTRAEAIVLDRIRRGPFRSPDDLARVDGIGLETVRGLGRFLAFPGDQAAGNDGADGH